MKRATALLLACLVLLLPMGCEKKTAQEVPGAQEVREEPGGSYGSRPAVTEESGGKTSGMVLKSDNRVFDQEAVAVLEELDRQLGDLIRALERMDEVKDEDLEY